MSGVSRCGSALVVGLALLGLSLPVQAEDLVPDNKKPEEIKKDEGWNFILTPGFSLAFADNRKVVGQPDGSTITLGINLLAGFDYKYTEHQVRTRLTINEAFSRNPILEEFVKSTDIFKFEALYLYSILPWLGPYVRLGIDSGILEGFDRHPEVTHWQINYLDGTVRDRWGYNLRLTDGFQPLVLRESAGFFAKPYDTPEAALEIRLGFGGLHGFADDQLGLKDDGATPALDVVELESFDQAVVELGFAFWGELMEKRVLYKIGAEFALPVVYDLPPDDDRGAFELTNIDINAMLSFKLLSWMSIDYILRVQRTPQLTDDFQIQNSLLLTASYAFFQPPAEEKK